MGKEHGDKVTPLSSIYLAIYAMCKKGKFKRASSTCARRRERERDHRPREKRGSSSMIKRRSRGRRRGTSLCFTDDASGEGLVHPRELCIADDEQKQDKIVKRKDPLGEGRRKTRLGVLSDRVRP